MSRPRTLDIVRTRGDTYSFSMVVGADCTGATFVLSVDTRKDPDDATTLLFALAGVVSDITATSSTVTFGPLSVEEADQDPDVYYHDVEMTDATAAVRTIAKGMWTVEQDIGK